VAYSIGQTAFGRLTDRIGTRRGLTLTVVWYSIVFMLTSLANGFYSLATLPIRKKDEEEDGSCVVSISRAPR
jgi:MFS family permease